MLDDNTRMTPQLNITDNGPPEEEKIPDYADNGKEQEAGIDFYPDRRGNNSSLMRLADEKSENPVEGEQTAEP